MIQISFDRYLLPATITRQSFVVLDANNEQLADPANQVSYDPVARTVTITGPGGAGQPWLQENLSYRLILPIATDPNTEIGGFRALDRATLGAAREWIFRAGPATGATAGDQPPVNFCADVLPIFTQKCSSPTCHSGSTDDNPRSAASLILTSSNGVAVTARGRVAQGSNTAPESLVVQRAGRLFGVNMAIIEKGDPGSSWLMYKLELAPPPVIFEDAGPGDGGDAGAGPRYECTPPAGAPPVPRAAGDYTPIVPLYQQAADDIERATLSQYVLGREMPYPPGQPLTFQEREKIRIWIARGAETPECGGCGEFVGPPRRDGGVDAGGTGDAGTGDAGDAGIVDASDQ